MFQSLALSLGSNPLNNVNLIFQVVYIYHEKLFFVSVSISPFSGSAAFYLVAKWISGFILEECSLWLEIRASVRTRVRASVRTFIHL